MLKDLLKRIEDPLLREEITRGLEHMGQGAQIQRLYIPEIGDSLILVAPWLFDLHYESRNFPLWKALGFAPSKLYSGVKKKVCLPVGTHLFVDRIYIRKGNQKYSSVTFRSRIPDIKAKPRFWVKLHDANLISFKEVDQKHG